MRSRRAALVALGAVLIGLALAAVIPLWGAPFEFKLESGETAGFIGDNGVPQWLVTLSLQNRGSRTVDFDTQRAKVEARVGAGWIATSNPWPVTYLRAHQKYSAMLFVPEATGACRFRLNYRSEPLSWRLWWSLDDQGAWRRFPSLGRWLRPGSRGLPKWRSITRDIELPRQSAESARAFAGAHNEVTTADGGWRGLFASVGQWPAAAWMPPSRCFRNSGSV